MFDLIIWTDNAAFEGEYLYSEVARILRETAERFEAGEDHRAHLFDVNGNRVGSFGWKEI